ncbi:HEXXH motif domain-containing protein [Streptomyces cinnabarinus]|uniref:HEXXH motif domain-containing protein n=1 Tax=Streptomyces cinnabarinus TaxID=67287 RepID=A0ABY7KG41_9ACTN|nr:HEXXH motif domain-containing protein [Streptomyces cinnabarinus]WAZ22533.1 HEXXH motif domain-containing protein [Streptomyces cinnabarinus]
MTSPHVLPADSFDELLGGGGGPAAVAELRASERSWRLLVVRALLDASGEAPAAAWRLLMRARAADQAAFEELLAYPAVGVWAAHTLRRLRGTAAGDGAPDTGYLHAVAAGAAIRAGLDFRTAVPVHEGWAVLPALGAMRVGGGASAEVTAVDGRVLVAGRPLGGPDWHPLTRLTAEGCGLLLDDTDPYRTLRTPLPAEPVDTDAWQGLFAEAWEILRGLDGSAARALADGLVTLVPRPRAERFRPHSASSGDAFGAALASVPDDGEQLASTLVHEFQHNKLSAFMHLFTLYDDQGSGGGRLHYAPWRDDPRPLGGLLQGVYAFFGVTGFWRRRAHPLGRFEFALWRAQTAHALRGIGAAEGLTGLGRRLVAELEGRLAPWLAEPVERRAAVAAELAVADHRATWRAYHLRPDPRVVRAYAAGGPPVADPAAPDLVPGTPSRGLDTRAVLARWLLADPAGFDALRADPGATVEGARPEDAALVGGDPERAARLCRERIGRGDGDPETWVGLGLAARASGDPAGAALLARPELVMAVHAELGAGADPLETARGLLSEPAPAVPLR